MSLFVSSFMGVATDYCVGFVVVGVSGLCLMLVVLRFV